MIKIFAILVAGTAAGFVAGSMTSSPAPQTAVSADAADYFDASAPVSERIAVLEQTVAAERDARLVLEEQITMLLEEIDRIDAEGPSVIAGDISTLVAERTRNEERAAAAATRREARRSMSDRERQVSRLTDGGFTPDRANAILDRTSELQWEIMQAQYQARSEGRRLDWGSLDANPNWRLRQELGDDEYARYLQAMGQPTSVRIESVYDSSPASRVGLQPGDEVLSYNGTRVFSTMELRSFATGGESSDDAVIEVLRNGATMQLTVPAGPMGVQVAGSRGTISTWRSN